MATLSDRIRELRKEKNLTQPELGKIIGMGKTTVSMYETGNSTPGDDIKLKMADYFDVSIDYLMGLSDIRKPNTEWSPTISDKDNKDLDRFNKELRDININGLRFSTTSKTFDIFFDNIFTDIAVNNQINKSYNDICSLQRNVETVLKNIKENKRQLLNIVNIKRKEYEEFINNL